MSDETSAESGSGSILRRFSDLSTGDGIALAGMFGAVAAGLLGYFQQEGALKVQDSISKREKSQAELSMVVGILSEKPEADGKFQEGQKVLRGWAVDVLNENHAVKIPAELKAVLTSGEASLRGVRYGGYDYMLNEDGSQLLAEDGTPMIGEGLPITLGGKPITLGGKVLTVGKKPAPEAPLPGRDSSPDQ
ncbi:hypothetical protein [Luteolibacter sp. Populi]|uniref:hypothetical protein n=1 Tax=Luteolibacter sp. Populi TaxID=3230487 RepID=UPI0034677670